MPTYITDEPPIEFPHGPLEYWFILCRRKKAVVLLGLMGCLISIGIALLQTPMYRAHAALEIRNINGDFLNTRQVNPVTDDSAGMNLLSDVQTQMRGLQSANLTNRVVDRLKKSSSRSEFLKRTSTTSMLWRRLLRRPESTPEQQEHETRIRAARGLDVRQFGQTRVIELYYDSPSATGAEEFLNTLIAEYVLSNIERREKVNGSTSQLLARQLSEMRASLERSENALEQYAHQSGLIFTTSPSSEGAKENVAEVKLRQLQDALSHAEADGASMQARYSIARSAAPETLPDVIDDDSLKHLAENLADLRRQEADLAAVYTSKSEKVRRITAQIVQVQAGFNQQRSAILARVANDYQAAVQREALLRDDYAKQANVVTEQAQKAIKYNILKREADSNRQLYDATLQQVRESSISSAMQPSNIQVLDRATVPTEIYSPNLKLNVALGLAFGLVIGIVFAIFSEHMDGTLREHGDITFWAGVPELGVIPNAFAKFTLHPYSSASRPMRTASVSSAGNILMALKEPNDKVSEIIAWRRKPGIVAEAFRTLMTSVMSSAKNGLRNRALLVTSASPLEGKTSVTSNLAISLAEIKRRVLIIDADLRYPRMHELFDLPNDRGLGTLLDSDHLYAELLAHAILPTRVAGLYVLPAGPATQEAANLLYSPHLPELITLFKQQFDLVLIDTPPMLEMTDARVAGKYADGIILVARSEKTTIAALRACIKRLEDDNLSVLGAVLNDWRPKRSRSLGYRYGNNYGDAASQRG